MPAGWSDGLSSHSYGLDYNRKSTCECASMLACEQLYFCYYSPSKKMTVYGTNIPGLGSLTSLSIAGGQAVTAISTSTAFDGANASDSNLATQLATKTYMDGTHATQTVASTFTGPWASGQSVTLYFSRIGQAVTCVITVASAACTNNGAVAVSGATDVPATYRPSTTSQARLWVAQNAGTYTTGSISVSLAGQITVYASYDYTTGFTSGSNAGWIAQIFSYSVN